VAVMNVTIVMWLYSGLSELTFTASIGYESYARFNSNRFTPKIDVHKRSLLMPIRIPSYDGVSILSFDVLDVRSFER